MVGPSSARVAAALAMSILAAACGDTHTPTMSDLAGVPELKERFNADAGKPRVVLLLSPT